ncbi:hypothetical protein ACHAXS_009249 [Conticribra weissflogii]
MKMNAAETTAQVPFSSTSATTRKRQLAFATLGVTTLLVVFTIFDDNASIKMSLRESRRPFAVTPRVLSGKIEPSSLLLLPENTNKETAEPTAWDIRVNERYYLDLAANSDSSITGTQAKEKDEFTTICLCPKCGTSSFYTKLFEVAHHKSVTYGYERTRWLWHLETPNWTNLDTRQKRDWSIPSHFSSEKSLVLIRDPKERLLSSWKSKIQCNADAVDTFDARLIIPALLDLGGFSHEILSYYNDKKGLETPCLDLSTFLLVMFQIHLQGKEGLVNDHLRPQHLICFLHVGPEKWGEVTTIDDSKLTCKLEKMLGIGSVGDNGEVMDCRDTEVMGKEHTTGDLSQYTTMTELDEAILNAITRKEYEVLGPYLN